MGKLRNKEITTRLNIKSKEVYVYVCKSLFRNYILDNRLRFFIVLRLSSFVTPMLVRNRCLLTGRSRGLINKLRLSRLIFKHMIKRGLLVGIRKRRW